jgi:hypothetical protein
MIFIIAIESLNKVIITQIINSIHTKRSKNIFRNFIYEYLDILKVYLNKPWDYAFWIKFDLKFQNYKLLSFYEVFPNQIISIKQIDLLFESQLNVCFISPSMLMSVYKLINALKDKTRASVEIL